MFKTARESQFRQHLSYRKNRNFILTFVNRQIKSDDCYEVARQAVEFLEDIFLTFHNNFVISPFCIPSFSLKFSYANTNFHAFAHANFYFIFCSTVKVNLEASALSRLATHTPARTQAGTRKIDAKIHYLLYLLELLENQPLCFFFSSLRYKT